MQTGIRIGLVGDYNESVIAHRAIPIALRFASAQLGVEVSGDWIGTHEIHDISRLAGCNGIWCVPASPYRNQAGALLAIRHARENDLPFLGTCGGFQHAVLEYAQNVLHWADAQHGETALDAERAVITPLECALVDTSGAIRLQPGSRVAAAYGVTEIVEGYHCSYGINPRFQAKLTQGPLRVTGRDEHDSIRAVELDAHPFFVATLFQPERAALTGRTPPLIRAFAAACGGHR